MNINSPDSNKTPRFSVTALVLSLISYWLPISGFILAIISLVYANKAIKEYNANPSLYKSKDIAYASKVMSIIRICLQVFIFIVLIFLLVAIVDNPVEFQTVTQEFFYKIDNLFD